MVALKRRRALRPPDRHPRKQERRGGIETAGVRPRRRRRKRSRNAVVALKRSMYREWIRQWRGSRNAVVALKRKNNDRPVVGFPRKQERRGGIET